MVKVKARECICEEGIRHIPGEIFEVSLERARALGNSVKIISKARENPPKNKAISEPKVKK